MSPPKLPHSAQWCRDVCDDVLYVYNYDYPPTTAEWTHVLSSARPSVQLQNDSNRLES